MMELQGSLPEEADMMTTSPAGRPRRARSLVAAVLLVLGLALLVAACGVDGAVGDGGAIGDGGAFGTTTSPEATGTGPGSSDTKATEPTEPSGDTTTTQAAGTDGSGTTTSVTPTTGRQEMTVNVYFARDEKMSAAGRVIPKTQSVGAASMQALLEGPTGAEHAAGMTGAIPGGTTLLGLDIKNGVATVDLSKEYASGGGSLSMMMRLAQVVFTLTQFPSVQGVSFMLDGKPIDVLGGEGIVIDHPMTRADYEDMSPAILVESPTLGATVSSPLRVTGTANVFEAVFRINIVDSDGLIIADERVQASSGTGTRGIFDVTVKYPSGHAGRGSLIVFENSAKDGTPTNVVEIPLVLE
jgi:germination protein M